VLNPISLENSHRTVVTTDWQGDGHTAARIFSAISNMLGQIDRIGRGIELSASHFKDGRIVKGGNDDFRHGYSEGLRELGWELRDLILVRMRNLLVLAIGITRVSASITGCSGRY